MKLTCKEAAVLVSATRDRDLNFSERWRLRLHLFICVACSRFAEQVRFLGRVARHAEHGPAVAMRLSVNAHHRITQRLRDEQRSSPPTSDV